MASKKGVCVVVGCGPGLGESVAVKFAKEGYKIAAMCRREDSFKAAHKSLSALPGCKFKFYACDATKQESVKKCFRDARKDLGGVEVLVYNAGGGGFGVTVLDIKPEAFVQSFMVSCTGALLCTQEVLPDMLSSSAKKKGTILYTSATSAFRGGAKTAQFACGKHALRALSQSVAKEYGKRGVHACHVRLDCILDTPGYVARYPDMHKDDRLASTDEIANSYWALHMQSPMAWSNEIDIRPYKEGWSC